MNEGNSFCRVGGLNLRTMTEAATEWDLLWYVEKFCFHPQMVYPQIFLLLKELFLVDKAKDPAGKNPSSGKLAEIIH